MVSLMVVISGLVLVAVLFGTLRLASVLIRRHGRARALVFSVSALGMAFSAVSGSEDEAPPRAAAWAVPTFHCLGIYWSPEEGGPGKTVSVKYRERGTAYRKQEGA